MAREMKVNATRPPIDQLIAKHAQILRATYEEQTAGDMTFTGLLAEFVWELKENGLLSESE